LYIVLGYDPSGRYTLVGATNGALVVHGVGDGTLPFLYPSLGCSMSNLTQSKRQTIRNLPKYITSENQIKNPNNTMFRYL